MAAATQKSKSAPANKDGAKVAKKAASAERSQKPEAAKPPAYLQAKLAVSHPQDGAEKEADHVARQVMRASKEAPAVSPAGAGKVQRASLGPAITPEKKETLALKPVPAAENIQRRAQSAEDKVQRDTEDGGADAMVGATVGSGLEARIESRRGAGSPLPATVAAEMSARFNHDFNAVRVHTDREAADLCAQTNARAFTVGSDIFFAPGEFSPETDAGMELLAHELTHVVQQGEGMTRAIMRGPTSGATTTPPPPPGGSGTGAASAQPPLAVANLPIPRFKFDSGRYQTASLIKAKEYNREGGNRTYQAMTWDRTVRKDAIAEKLTNTVGMNLPNHTYAVVSNPRPVGSSPVGDASTIAGGLLRPWWTSSNQSIAHEVDHVVELQLSGWPRIRTGDQINNYEMVDHESNGLSGTQIDQALVNAVEAAVPGANAREVMRSRDILVTSVRDSGTLANASRWTRSQIEEGAHIDSALAGAGSPRPVEFWDLNDPTAHGHFSAPPGSVNTENYTGSSNKLVIYYGATGGAKTAINFSSAPEDQASPELANPRGIFIHGFDISKVTYHRRTQSPGRASRSDPVGVIQGRAFRNQTSTGRAYSTIGEVSWPIRSMPTTDYAGYLDAQDLRNLVSFSLNFMSPIEFGDLTVDPAEGLVMRGKVLPTLPLLQDADVDIVFAGDDLRLEKFFSIEEFKLPPPLHVDSCSVGISLGIASGLRFSGMSEFSIDRLGHGSFTGSVGTRGDSPSIALEGNFDFDSQLFDRASIQAWYREGQFGAAGDISIDSPDKVRGIRSASLHVEYEGGHLRADGSVQPNIPGIQQAGLRVDYAEDTGLTIGGTLQLAPNPAIRSGSVDITVRKVNDQWKVAATGTAQPAIPGIDSQLTVGYDDGAFTAEFSGSYGRGMMSGSATVGVTNRTVGEDGRPSGAPVPDAPLLVYGNGSATLRIAPWLQGTAGIRFAPNGEATISGEIGLPSSLEIFSIREVNRQLFGMSTQIPIFPGIVAEVGGNLSAHASIGPGALDQMRLGIEYNPSHEENTRITGDAHLNIPAEAGLRLAARAGIGLGITGASATGGLELGGTLGIGGAAEASVHIEWTPTSGLQIEAEGYLHAEPKFKFDVSGYVAVTALGFSIYDNTWRLAEYELGSNLRLGLRFPIRYQEGQPFNVSLDDVQFEVPDVDPVDMVRDLGNRIF